MPDPNTISVELGSVFVIGSGTAFVAAENDTLMVEGDAVPIDVCLSLFRIRLKQPWAKPTKANIPSENWDIVRTGPYWNSSISTNIQLAELLRKFEAGPFKWDASGPLSERGLYNDQKKDFVFLATGDPLKFYIKTSDAVSSEAWSAGYEIKGSEAVSTAEAKAAAYDAGVSRDASQAAATTSQQSAAIAQDGKAGSQAALEANQNSATISQQAASVAQGASAVAQGAATTSQSAAATSQGAASTAQGAAAASATSAASSDASANTAGILKDQATAAATVSQDASASAKQQADASAAKSALAKQEADRAAAAAGEAAYQALLISQFGFDMGTLDQADDNTNDFDFGVL